MLLSRRGKASGRNWFIHTGWTVGWKHDTTFALVRIQERPFLLVVPILVLYFVINPNARLALTITFIIAFAIGLSATTSANRDAIFAATAAYSAVLVVFVSGDLANAK